MPGVTFQATVGTSAVQLSTVPALSGADIQSGIKIVIPAANTGLVYYGFSSGVTASNGCLIPNGVPFTINPSELPPNANGRPDLASLWLISPAAGQVVTGVVL